MIDTPLVSCLCVSKNKLDILKRSITCFRAQSYPSKELIILRKGDDKKISAYLKSLADPRIVYRTVPANLPLSLGELRNLSIEFSTGEYFCGWDDDDWNHADRLSLQTAATLNSRHPASALTNLLVFDETSGKAYFSLSRLWEGTLLCKRELYSQKIRYPSATKGEDTGLLDLLLAKARVIPVISSTEYVYVYHGKNTWSAEHFKKFIFNQPLSKKTATAISTVLRPTYGVVKGSKLLDKSPIKNEINYFVNKSRFL